MERNLTFDPKTVQRLRLKLTWAQLELDQTNADEFQLMVSGDDDSVEELRIEQPLEGLLIAQPQLSYAKEILPRRRWLQICLRVPKSWRGEMDADTVSGTISARAIAGDEINLTSVSGSMNARDVEANQLWLHSVSSAISGSNLRATRANLRSVSGDIALTECAFESTKLFTISGDIRLDLAPGSRIVDSQSVSGSVTIETEGPANASLHALSGQYIRSDDVPAGTGGIDISASSVSGDLAVRKRRNVL